MKLRTAVLASGTGRSLRNLLERQRAGTLPAEIVLVVASRAGIGALDHAREHGVRSVVLAPPEIARALDEERVELVILAGYLKRWPLPDRYLGKTINIHPSLLPLFGGKGFYGDKVHEAVLRSGMRVAGCTVHFVTAEFDAGPIIAQRAVPVLPGDDVPTLASRVFAAELELLPEVVRDLAEGRVRYEHGRVVHRE